MVFLLTPLVPIEHRFSYLMCNNCNVLPDSQWLRSDNMRLGNVTR